MDNPIQRRFSNRALSSTQVPWHLGPCIAASGTASSYFKQCSAGRKKEKKTTRTIILSSTSASSPFIPLLRPMPHLPRGEDATPWIYVSRETTNRCLGLGIAELRAGHSSNQISLPLCDFSGNNWTRNNPVRSD